VSHAVTVAGWIVLACAIVTACGLSIGPRRRVPTFAMVMRSLARFSVARVVLLLVWIWVGWHFFVRTTR
jgi:hypothetical protein